MSWASSKRKANLYLGSRRVHILVVFCSMHDICCRLPPDESDGLKQVDKWPLASSQRRPAAVQAGLVGCFSWGGWLLGSADLGAALLHPRRAVAVEDVLG